MSSSKHGFCSSSYATELLAVVMRECRRLDGDTIEGWERFRDESRHLLTLFRSSYGQRNMRKARKVALKEYDDIIALTKQKGFEI